MPLFDGIKKYSKTVCEQIRWKKAHSIITKEIENHLCDQRDAYMADGENEEQATEQAILQMGDPIVVGMELDQAHRPKPQWVLVSLTLLLMQLGIVTRYAIDPSREFNMLPSAIDVGAVILTYFLDFSLSSLILLCVSIAKGWFGINKKRGLLLVLIPTTAVSMLGFLWAAANTNLSQRADVMRYPAGFIRDLMTHAQFIGEGSLPSKYGTETPFQPSFFLGELHSLD